MVLLCTFQAGRKEGVKMKKKEIFKDIKIIEKKGGWGLHKQVHTIGWKFEYKGNQYGNYISDQVPTGETYTYWDDDEEAECIGHVMKTVPLTGKDQIGLMKNMIEAMEKLIKGKK